MIQIGSQEHFFEHVGLPVSQVQGNVFEVHRAILLVRKRRR